MASSEKKEEETIRYAKPLMRRFDRKIGIGLDNLVGKGIKPQHLERMGADRVVKQVSADLQGRNYVFDGVEENSIAFRHPDGHVIVLQVHPERYVAKVEGMPKAVEEQYFGFFTKRGIHFTGQFMGTAYK